MLDPVCPPASVFASVGRVARAPRMDNRHRSTKVIKTRRIVPTTGERFIVSSSGPRKQEVLVKYRQFNCFKRKELVKRRLSPSVDRRGNRGYKNGGDYNSIPATVQ